MIIVNMTITYNKTKSWWMTIMTMFLKLTEDLFHGRMGWHAKGLHSCLSTNKTALAIQSEASNKVSLEVTNPANRSSDTVPLGSFTACEQKKRCHQLGCESFWTTNSQNINHVVMKCHWIWKISLWVCFCQSQPDPVGRGALVTHGPQMALLTGGMVKVEMGSWFR